MGKGSSSDLQLPIEIVELIVRCCAEDNLCAPVELTSDGNEGQPAFLGGGMDRRMFAFAQMSRALRTFTVPLAWRAIRIDSRESIAAFRYFLTRHVNNAQLTYGQSVADFTFTLAGATEQAKSVTSHPSTSVPFKYATIPADAMQEPDDLESSVKEILRHLPRLRSIAWDTSVLQATDAIDATISRTCGHTLRHFTLSGETNADAGRRTAPLADTMRIVESLYIADALLPPVIELEGRHVYFEERMYESTFAVHVAMRMYVTGDAGEENDVEADDMAGFRSTVLSDGVSAGTRYLMQLFFHLVDGALARLRVVRVRDDTLLRVRMMLPLLLCLERVMIVGEDGEEEEEEAAAAAAAAETRRTPCERAFRHLQHHLRTWPHRTGVDWVLGAVDALDPRDDGTDASLQTAAHAAAPFRHKTSSSQTMSEHLSRYKAFLQQDDSMRTYIAAHFADTDETDARRRITANVETLLTVMPDKPSREVRQEMEEMMIARSIAKHLVVEKEE